MSSEMITDDDFDLWDVDQTSIIERVAAAMKSAEIGAPAWSGQKEVSLIMARAAIEEMRLPTEAMKNAACEVGPDTNSGQFDHDDASAVYTAMIDAALKDTP
jgi:hypothetical protein